jgi:hypothetical protein
MTIVFWGGTNDVSKNNSQDGLKHTANFVKMNSHTNIILMSAPHRHDLYEWSCVNSEVKAFSRKLVKLMKPYEHVIVVKVCLDRKFFTRQGLHTNNLGKERIALKIANVVTKIFMKQADDPISLYWKNEHDVSVSDSSNEDNTILQEHPKAAPLVTANVEALIDYATQEELLYKGPRTSRRQKKPPTTKNDDFFYGK